MAYSVGTGAQNSGLSSAANIATSSTITVSAGGTIVVFVHVAQDQTATLAASDGTNTYTRRHATYYGSSSTFGVLVAENCSAGTYTVTATWDGGTRANRAIAAIPLSGLKAASYQTGATNTQATPGTGTDAVTSGNMTPTEQPAALFGFHISLGALNTPSAGTGFTSAGTFCDFGTGTNVLRAQHKRLTSTSAVASTATATANNLHASVAVVLSEEVSGGGSIAAISNYYRMMRSA